MGQKHSYLADLNGVPPDAKLVPEFTKMREGAVLIKFTTKGPPHQRTFQVSPDGSILFWKSRGKNARDSMIFLRRVKRLQPGIETDTFRRFPHDYDKNVCFSIITPERSFDLVCESREQYDLWFNGLSKLIDLAHADPLLDFIKTEWALADSDRSGSLELREVLKLCGKLNMKLKKEELIAQFKKADKDGNGSLNFTEFTEFIHDIRLQRHVTEIFEKFAPGGQMRVADFIRFMFEYQHETIDEAQAKELFAKFESDSADTMTVYGFTEYMNDVASDVGDPKALSSVCHDMTRPLSHYFIASSHNTYLEGDQLRSDSSVNAYVRAMQSGCRCVELDCWDGDDGEPIIYHGHTLTSRIQFRDVIRAIRDHGFETTPYPLILSIENHCSVPQQQRMAAIFSEVLNPPDGEQMMPTPLVGRTDVDWLPSPEEYRRKVLIKGNTLPLSSAQSDEVEIDDDDDDDDGADQAAPATDGGAATAAARRASQSVRTSSAAGEYGATVTEGASEYAPAQVETVEYKSSKPSKKAKIAKELSDLVHLKATRFKSFSACSGLPYEMSSFSEGKTNTLLKKQPEDFIAYNKKQLSRIYPAGIRVNSSNYDPAPAWNAGCQIVALNYQTSDEAMMTNIGKFRENNSCGYLLKPQFLIDAEASFAPSKITTPRIRLEVEVISARQLPKIDNNPRGEIIDPFVKVIVAGVDADCKQYKTKTIEDNGFNPVWQETFTFDICVPELALLKFLVYDEDFGKNDFVAYRVLPIPLVRTGLRSVFLYDSKHAKIEFSSLLCRFTISPIAN